MGICPLFPAASVRLLPNKTKSLANPSGCDPANGHDRCVYIQCSVSIRNQHRGSFGMDYRRGLRLDSQSVARLALGCVVFQNSAVICLTGQLVSPGFDDGHLSSQIRSRCLVRSETFGHELSDVCFSREPGLRAT